MEQQRTLTTSFLDQKWTAVTHPSQQPQGKIFLERCAPRGNRPTHDVADYCGKPRGVDILTVKRLLENPSLLIRILDEARSKKTITVLCTGTTFVGEDRLKAIFMLQYTPGNNVIHFGYVGKKRDCRLKNVYRLVYGTPRRKNVT